jgi:hypothetical protein
MKVREDIFPEIKAHEKLQEYLNGLTDIAYQAFTGLFSSVTEVVQYINNFEKPEIAKLFLEIGEYYYSAKFYYCPHCFPPKRIEKCPHCNSSFEMPAHLVLIMIISIMERISLGFTKYADFFEWTGRKETVERLKTEFESVFKPEKIEEFISAIREDWSKDYGSVTKITSFFKDFMKKEEKMEFVKSIRFMMKVPELPPKHMESINGKTPEKAEEIFENWKQTFEKEQQLVFETDEDVKKYVIRNNSKTTWEALPICFDKKEHWKCYSRNPYGQGLGYCHYNYFCNLYKDEELLDKCFDKTVKTLYDWRSEFVHNAKIPPINETAIHGGIYKKKSIIVELTTKELKPVFEKMLKRYFDQHQKINSKDS